MVSCPLRSHLGSSHFGSSHFLSNSALFARAPRLWFFRCLLRPRQPWHLMPRKGWSTLEVPDGWLQVIRGPRPPAVQWPKAVRGQGQGQPKFSPHVQFRQPGVTTTWQGVGQSAQPRGRVESALGSEDVAAKTEVEAALQRAREEKSAQPQQSWWTPDRSGTCPVQRSTLRGSVEGNGRSGVRRLRICGMP